MSPEPAAVREARAALAHGHFGYHEEHIVEGLLAHVDRIDAERADLQDVNGELLRRLEESDQGARR